VHVVIVADVDHDLSGGMRFGVIGASGGYEGLVDLNRAILEHAVLRFFPSHTYRKDFCGFRRMPCPPAPSPSE